MSKKRSAKLSDYADLVCQVKARIQQGQTRAVLSVNAELVRLYWDIGRMLHGRQSGEGYGTRVVPRLAQDLRNELPEVRGFSERNIGRMIAFFRAYPRPDELLPQVVAKTGSEVLPQPAAKVASEVLPQPAAKVRGRKNSPQAVARVAAAAVVPQAAAQPPVLDDELRHPTDAPTIGLILCQNRNGVVAEYALRGMTQPIGVSQYELTRALPRELRSSLPSIEEIEAELAGASPEKPAARRRPVKKKAKRKRAKS